MFRLILTRTASKFLKKLSKETRKNIVRKLHVLKFSPELGKPLSNDLRGMRSLRIGKYRALYYVNVNTINVVSIGHRKNIY